MKSNDDTQLQHDVLAELEWDPSIDAARIGVAAHDGVVTLTGVVESNADKMAAERLALRVRGVKAVANDIEVRVPGASQRSDADIAAAVVGALRWHARVPDEALRIVVRAGQVVLDGTVDWAYQREAAEEAVRDLAGVAGVVNQIKIRPQPEAEDVKDRIEAALKRRAGVDATRVKAEVRGGTVILTGTVRSWAERQTVEQAAWSTPGVSDVDNLIEIAS